ncbi:hypothetical protein AB6846_03020 [Serratia proteamaculans]
MPVAGVSAETIAALAREFTSYQRQAAVIAHGGMMELQRLL